MSLKAGRSGVNSKQVDPVNGSIKGDLITYGPGVLNNADLTNMVSLKEVQYKSKSDKIAAVNTALIQQIGRLCVCSMDFTVGAANISAWTDDVFVFEGFSCRDVFAEVVRDVTDPTGTSYESVLIKVNGGFTTSKVFVANRRYQLNFVFVNMTN